MKERIALFGLLVLTLGISGCGSRGSIPGTPVKYTLTISIEGQGTVTPPGGSRYDAGTVVTLSPTAAPDWDFTEWSGPDGPSVVANQITMDGDKSLVAVFTSYPFMNLTAGSVETYYVRSTIDENNYTECQRTVTVMGPTTFNADPDAVQVKSVLAYEPADYMYLKPVSGGILLLGFDSNLYPGTPPVAYDPAPTLPTLKVGQSFSTQQDSATLTFTAVGTEFMKVPAGLFKVLKVLKTTSGSEMTETYWLGPNGIGTVRYEAVVDGVRRELQELIRKDLK